MKARIFQLAKNVNFEEKMAESQNADLSRKFITRRKSIYFGAVLGGHKGRNISKIS